MKYCIFLFLGLLLPGMAFAGDMNTLAAQLNTVAQSKDSLAKAIRDGKRRAILCGYCHGMDGNSKKTSIPKLAGQHPKYLLIQFEHFSNGTRKNYVMQELAKDLSDKDRINVALYFSSLSPRPEPADAALAAKGKAIYDSRCTSCHGMDGRGHAEFPRLANQHVQYVEHTLQLFATPGTERNDPIMGNISQRLSKSDVKAVANYIASMRR